MGKRIELLGHSSGMIYIMRGVDARPISYSVDAMGDSSECMVMMPSNGLSGGGLTIFASTCATTLVMVEEGTKGGRDASVSFECKGYNVRLRTLSDRARILPSLALVRM